MADGLKPMRRQYVHLTGNVSLAAHVGHRRQREPMILEIRARRAHEDGITFYQVDRDVWLVEYLPPEYIAGYRPASQRESNSEDYDEHL